jgi:CHAT domain-containing protein
LADSDQRRLLEDFIMSIIPSASVYAQCSKREAGRGSGCLILAVADDLAPQVVDEASAVAAILPDCELLVGGEATASALLAKAGPKRYVHIAAHGLQRRDNPLYSSIKLGNSELRLC